MLDGMAFGWLTVFLDFPADAVGAGMAFWQEVTGYRLSVSRGAAGEFATLLPPSGDAYLRVQRLLDGGGGCHLDLHVDTASEPLAEAAGRAVALGARVRSRDGDSRGDRLIIADSPGGFTFCLVEWRGESVVPAPLASDGGGTSRVDTLCLDVPPTEFERECSFWAELTGWELRPATVPGFRYLRRPAGMPARLLFQRLDSAAPGERVRAHLDFGCTDADREVSRHVGLGARVVGTFPHWTVLTDPAGREYCLVSRAPDTMRSTPDPVAFARRWAAEWNARDLEAILAHYAPDVVFRSPVAARVLPGSAGTVRGLDALRHYWSTALTASPGLRFEVLDVYAGIDTLVIRFRNEKGELRAEVLTFRDGLIVEGRGLFLVES
jgi:ketosteroid isomerase-like protein